jgi:hypothetical protein
MPPDRIYLPGAKNQQAPSTWTSHLGSGSPYTSPPCGRTPGIHVHEGTADAVLAIDG